MTRSLAPLAAIVAVLLTGCNDEATDNEPDPQAIPSQGTVQQVNAAQADAAPATVELPCESARLLKIRTVERTKRGSAGRCRRPTKGAAPAPDVFSRARSTTSPWSARERPTWPRVVGGTPGFRPGDLEATSTLRLRAEGGKLFLKREGGTEFEATLAAAGSPRVPPPK